MQFIDELNAKLDELHLLKHPFYKAWDQGKISKDTLKTYAQQYWHHVEAFPRYVSTIHSQCLSILDRQMLLENLIEEERGDENHPELWLRFSEGLGCNRDEVKNSSTQESKELVDGYFELTRSSFAVGIGALYAYERQTPDVAKSKIASLRKFYNVNDDRSLKFFAEHIGADEWHSRQCGEIIEKLDADSQKQAEFGAVKGAGLLWKFLDNMNITEAS
jgi:pyrroloquinoline-quinone synthase